MYMHREERPGVHANEPWHKIMLDLHNVLHEVSLYIGMRPEAIFNIIYIGNGILYLFFVSTLAGA